MRHRRSSKNITPARTIAMVALLALGTSSTAGCTDDSTVGLGATVSVEALMQRDATSYRARIATAPDGARVLAWMENQSANNASSQSLLARQLGSASDTGIDTWFDDESADFVDFDFISGNLNEVGVTNLSNPDVARSWERWRRAENNSDFERSDAYASTASLFVGGGEGLLVWTGYGFLGVQSQSQALDSIYQSPDGLTSAEGYGPISGPTAAGGTIFFGQNNDLLSIPTQPGAGMASPTLLFTLPGKSTVVATATQKNLLFWIEQQDDGETRSIRIHRSSFDGSGDEVVVEYPNSGFNLTVAGNLVCWISSGNVYDYDAREYTYTDDDQVVCADQTRWDPVVIATQFGIRTLRIVDDNQLLWLADGATDGESPSQPYQGPTAFWLATFSGD